MSKNYNRLSLLPKLHGQWTYIGRILRSNQIPLYTTMENITIEQCIIIAKELGYKLWVFWDIKWIWKVEENKNEIWQIGGGCKNQVSAFKAGLNCIIEAEYDKKYPDAKRYEGMEKSNLYSGCRQSTSLNKNKGKINVKIS